MKLLQDAFYSQQLPQLHQLGKVEVGHLMFFRLISVESAVMG